MSETITPAQLKRRQARSMRERGKNGLQQQVVEIAAGLNWLVHHVDDKLFQLAIKEGRFDAIPGAEHFPDVIAIRGDRLLAIELKTQYREPTDEQEVWLRAFEDAGAEVYRWKPSDLLAGVIHETLR